MIGTIWKQKNKQNAFEYTGIEHQKAGEILKNAWKFRNTKKRARVGAEKAVKNSLQWDPKHNSGPSATESGHTDSLL